MRHIPEDIEAILARVERSADGCWLWPGAKTTAGYGYVKRAGFNLLVHRLAYHAWHGGIPDGAIICHHCDTPLCVNPAHLYAGSKATNAQDRADRKRGREHRPENRGERNRNAKLTDADVAVIRERYRSGGVTQEALAAEFGVKQPQISRIVLRTSRTA